MGGSRSWLSRSLDIQIFHTSMKHSDAHRHFWPWWVLPVPSFSPNTQSGLTLPVTTSQCHLILIETPSFSHSDQVQHCRPLRKSSHPSLCLSVCVPSLQCASPAGRTAGLPDRTLWRSREDRLPVRTPGCVCLMSAAHWSVCWHCQEAKDVSGSFVFHLSTPGPVHFPEHFWERQMHRHDAVLVNTLCLTHGQFEFLQNCVFCF